MIGFGFRSVRLCNIELRPMLTIKLGGSQVPELKIKNGTCSLNMYVCLGEYFQVEIVALQYNDVQFGRGHYSVLFGNLVYRHMHTAVLHTTRASELAITSDAVIEQESSERSPARRTCPTGSDFVCSMCKLTMSDIEV